MTRKPTFISALLAVLMGGFFVCGANAQSNSVVILPNGCGTADFFASSGYLTVDSTGKLCTSGSGGGGGGTSSNFNAAFPTAGTAIGFSNGTNMVPGLVDGSGYLEVNVKAGGAGGGAVYGPTAGGSAAANPPVQIGGVQTNSNTGLVQPWVINSSGNGLIDAPSGSNLANLVSAPLPVIAGTAPGTQTPVSTGSTTKAQSDLNGNLYSNPVSQYPAGATAITASATGTTAATTATLAATLGKTTYICGYSIRANATANTNVTDTITGVITGTLSSILWVPANTAGLGVDEQIFNPCIPASGTNTAIAIVSGAPGTGGLVSSKGWGYQQ